jgi:hypothetical protein
MAERPKHIVSNPVERIKHLPRLSVGDRSSGLSAYQPIKRIIRHEEIS